MPAAVIPYLGLLPLALGIRVAWRAWRERRDTADEEPAAVIGNGPSFLAVATVTFANGGDNIGVYVSFSANAGAGGLIVFAAAFLVLVAVWCLLGRFFATLSDHRPRPGTPGHNPAARRSDWGRAADPHRRWRVRALARPNTASQSPATPLLVQCTGHGDVR
jgi:hypothetical protein